MIESKLQKKLYLTLIGIGIFPFMINGYVNSIIYQNHYLYWCFEIVTWVILPIIIFFIAMKFGNLSFSEIGIHTRICGKRNLPLLMFICVIFCPFDYWLYRELIYFFQSIYPSESLFAYQSVTPNEGFSRVIVAIYFGLSAGIVEELYFRGFMFRICQLFINTIPIYLILSPVLFSLIHWESGVANMLSTYIFGFIGALIFLWFKNLWPLIIGHIYTDYVWFS
ncbi:MAG TPA: CPBP family intramembrane metalloprotease [Thiotrichaceae bacterium]|jgi:membrane protease YdiL (CAAX protease family)|nr:CPBP family intramembrane metalloprotease [Thiotrichaceae bacterium]HIM08915.1 CPBP family intramembrane metalloprotease [Gammaproteobacteria bacterium]